MQKTSECSLQEVEPILREMIASLMEPGEEVLACFHVEFNMLWIDVITTRQVIVAKAIALRSGMLKFKVQLDMPHVSSMLLQEIVSYELGRDPEYDLYTVTLSGQDGKQQTANFTLETAAQKFQSTLGLVLNKDTKTAAPSSAASRLRELVELKEAGLITEEEYQKKRAEILDQL